MADLPPNRITELRKARGLTIEELAERAGFSAGFISHMANGGRNISLKNLDKLATALQCRPEDLIGASEPTRIGEILRDARKKRGWTQAQVGEHLQVSPNAVSMWESGTIKPALPMLVGLSKLFDIPTDTLLTALSEGDEGEDRQPERAGGIIRQERTRRGWSQAELGERLGVTRSAVNQWEVGKTLPAADMLSSVASVLGVSLDEMMGKGSATGDANVNRANQIDPVLTAVWEKMTPAQRRKLVQIAVIIAEDK